MFQTNVTFLCCSLRITFATVTRMVQIGKQAAFWICCAQSSLSITIFRHPQHPLLFVNRRVCR
jgi:hypothetical protein